MISVLVDACKQHLQQFKLFFFFNIFLNSILHSVCSFTIFAYRYACKPHFLRFQLSVIPYLQIRAVTLLSLLYLWLKTCCTQSATCFLFFWLLVYTVLSRPVGITLTASTFKSWYTYLFAVKYTDFYKVNIKIYDILLEICQDEYLLDWNNSGLLDYSYIIKKVGLLVWKMCICICQSSLYCIMLCHPQQRLQKFDHKTKHLNILLGH